jgi:sugar phosphate isomerase/epimerase
VKYAICNELYEGWAFEDVCKSVAETGYTGLEIAPFTLAPLATDFTKEQRRVCRRQAEDAGLSIIGLHWLFAKTSGFHVTSPDPTIREQTARYLIELVNLCADLGGNVLVFGSPNARALPEGASLSVGFQYAADTLRTIGVTLSDRRVNFLLEPLGPKETNFLNTANQAARLLTLIDHPRFGLHLDVKAMSSESSPIPEILHASAQHLKHFHANDPNLRGPGMGEVDFTPIFKALREIDYGGWVSVEVFDFKPDPETIARESLAYMKRIAGLVEGSDGVPGNGKK